jgi:hypothetical protein
MIGTCSRDSAVLISAGRCLSWDAVEQHADELDRQLVDLASRARDVRARCFSSRSLIIAAAAALAGHRRQR